MNTNRTPPRATLARNIKYLLDTYDMSQQDLAKKAGVSQKTISNLCNPNGNQPKLDGVESVAAAFGLNLWHLILPDLPDDLIHDQKIERLITNYMDASQEGRDHINMVAEREAKYSK